MLSVKGDITNTGKISVTAANNVGAVASGSDGHFINAKETADLLLAALAMGSVATGLLYSKRKKKEA